MGNLGSHKLLNKITVFMSMTINTNDHLETTNDLLQLRRSYRSLNPQWCIHCKGEGESIDHLFLHCPFTCGLWNKFFNLARIVWVSPRSIEDMFIIAFKGFGNSFRGKTLWRIDCLSLVCVK